MQDKSLKCRDCGADFSFSVSEQEFFAQKGFMHEPSRCPDCRSARKSRVDGGSGIRREREMYSIVCAACGKDGQVPFMPRNDRPVYCSDCYSTRQPAGGYSGSGASSGGSRSRSW